LPERSTSRKIPPLAARDQSTAVTAAYYKGRLFNRRIDNDAIRLVQQILWNPIRHAEDFFHYIRGCVDAVVRLFFLIFAHDGQNRDQHEDYQP